MRGFEWDRLWDVTDWDVQNHRTWQTPSADTCPAGSPRTLFPILTSTSTDRFLHLYPPFLDGTLAEVPQTLPGHSEDQASCKSLLWPVLPKPNSAIIARICVLKKKKVFTGQPEDMGDPSTIGHLTAQDHLTTY